MRFLLLSFCLIHLLLVPSDGITGSGQTLSDTDRQQLDWLYEEAVKQIRAQDFQAATAAFQQLLQIDSTHYEARLGLGEIYLRQERFAAARQQLEKASALAPHRLEARFQLARTCLYLGRQPEARQNLQGIVADFPGQTPPRIALGDLLMNQAPPDPQGALRQYEAIIQQEPDNLRAHTSAATARLRLGLFAPAASALAPLVEADPRNPNLTFLFAVACHMMGDYERAITAYRQSVDALPVEVPQRLGRLWNLRFVYLAAHGQYPGALPAAYQLRLAPVAGRAPVRFTDIAAAAGLARKDRGRGSAWGDYDGDGDLDLFAVGLGVPHALYRNEHGRSFTDIARSAGLHDVRGGWSATCADYDNDGDLDLYVTRDAWEGRAPNSLYQNRGDGSFTEVSTAAGVDDPDASCAAAWADYDSDGFLDLYVADGITGDRIPNKLYHNQGNGSFTELAERAGVAHTGRSPSVAFGDYDDDGDPDLYVVDESGPNVLYRNEGSGRFADITARAGVEAPRQGGSATFFFDYDSDGDLDLFVSATATYEFFVLSQITGRDVGPTRACLYRNDGRDTFTDVAVAAGLGRAFGSTGAGCGDVDYDGRLDLYLANGGLFIARFEPNVLFHNAGDRFVDISAAAGVDNPGKGYDVTFADYDSDGDLDFYVGTGGRYPIELCANSLYRNEGHDNHWLSVEVRGQSSNRSAIGTRLRLRADQLVQGAEVSSGGGLGSSGSLSVEFGLGRSTRIDTLEIRWPSGRTEAYPDLEADQFLRFVEER